MRNFYWENGFYTEQNLEKSRIEITSQKYDELLTGVSNGLEIFNNNGNLELRKIIIPQEEINKQKITELKQKLTDTDYKAIKFAEGAITVDEYAETKSLRQQWRQRINELE